MRALTAALALVLAILLAGCAAGVTDQASVVDTKAEGMSVGEDAAISMGELGESVEARAASFLRREGSALHRSLARFLGGEIATRVSPGDTECRSGTQTAAIADPEKFPFACIVQGSADGRGLTVNITLGFVGLGLTGRCWQAANERVTVTATAPALLSRRQAMRPVNRIAGCIRLHSGS